MCSRLKPYFPFSVTIWSLQIFFCCSSPSDLSVLIINNILKSTAMLIAQIHLEELKLELCIRMTGGLQHQWTSTVDVIHTPIFSFFDELVLKFISEIREFKHS